MQLEPGVGGQPPLDRWGLVGRGVIADHMHTKLGWNGLVDAGQKAAELDGAVPAGQIGDHLARGHIQGGVQVGGAMAGVVMGGPLGGPWQQRQHRSGPVQRLHLGLLIHAQHQGGLGWVEVQPDDVADLVDELRIGRELERLGEMRLEPERPPDPADRGLVQPQGPRQRPGRPMGGIGGGGLQGGDDDPFDVLVGELARGARTGLVHQALQPAGHKPRAPLDDRGPGHAEVLGDLGIASTFGAGQHDPAALGQRLAGGPPPGPALQGGALLVS